jgi:hypothetical protein
MFDLPLGEVEKLFVGTEWTKRRLGPVTLPWTEKLMCEVTPEMVADEIERRFLKD